MKLANQICGGSRWILFALEAADGLFTVGIEQDFGNVATELCASAPKREKGANECRQTF